MLTLQRRIIRKWSNGKGITSMRINHCGTIRMCTSRKSGWRCGGGRKIMKSISVEPTVPCASGSVQCHTGVYVANNRGKKGATTCHQDRTSGNRTSGNGAATGHRSSNTCDNPRMKVCSWNNATCDDPLARNLERKTRPPADACCTTCSLFHVRDYFYRLGHT